MQTINNSEIKTAMTTAQMDARMVAEASMDYETAEGLAFLDANDKADRGAVYATKANDAAAAWINSNEGKAMEIIARRIAKRAATTCAATDRMMGL